MGVPRDVLETALHALETASRDVRSHGDRQQAEAQIHQWRAQVGLGGEAVEIALFCLEHSAAVRARFFACATLGHALPHCLARGLLPVDQIWTLRTHLLHLAVSFRAASETRILSSAVIAVIGPLTVVGFALPPASHDPTAAETSQAVHRPRGFSALQRLDVWHQLDSFLQAPVDPTHPDRSLVGLHLASELIDRFDDRNALGAIKPRATSGIKMLSWPESQQAKRAFADELLPHLTSTLLHLVASLIAGTIEPSRHLVKDALSTLNACFEFHHDAPHDSDADRVPALLMPGVYNAGSSLQATGDDHSSRPPPVARHLNSSMAAVVQQVAVLHLLENALGRLRRGVGDEGGTANGAMDDIDDDDALTSCRQCLESVAAFSTPSVDWTAALLATLSPFVDAAHAPDEILFLSRTFRTILTTTSVSIMLSRQDLLHVILRALPAIALKAVHFSAPSPALRVNMEAWDEAEKSGMEALQEVCEAMYKLVQIYEPSGMTEQLSAGAAAVFSAFIDAKVEGARLRAVHEAEADYVDEEVQAGMKDKDISQELLVAVAALGRLAPHAASAHLDRLTNQLSARMLNLIHRETHPSDSADDVSHRELELAVVHEQTHWVVLIAGFLLADEGVGEIPIPPEGLVNVSRSQPAPSDPVLQIASSLLHLYKSTTVASKSLAASRCSPQIAEDLHWFIGRWSLTYLLSDSSTVTSPNLHAAFNGDAGLETLHHIFYHLARAVKQHSAEEDVLIEIGAALTGMSRSRTLCESMTRLRSFAEFVESVLHESAVISSKATAALWRGILRCVGDCLHISEGRSLFGEVIRVTEGRMRQVFESPDYRADPALAPVVLQVNSVLDSYIALTSSYQDAATDLLIPAFANFCPVALGLLDVYKDAEEVLDSITKFFEELARLFSFSLCGIDGIRAELAGILSALQGAIYRVTQLVSRPSADPSSQRDQMTRMLLIVEHLVHFGGSADDPASWSGQANGVVHAGHSANGMTVPFDLVAALRSICPLIAPSMLLFPFFLSQWAKTLNASIRYMPEQVEAATEGPHGEAVRTALLGGLGAMLGSVNDDVVLEGLETGEAMARLYSERGSTTPTIATLLELAFRTCLHTLCFEPCSSSFVTQYLHVVQISLLAFSRHDPARIRGILEAFVAAHHGRASTLLASLERLVGLLTSTDALVSAPGRGDAAKLTLQAQTDAIGVLRELRLDVRL